ncbi:hypothetical protein [Enemella dayhoffiae]|uniref:hypothetical protein n=1 Tax=Enemella dayhoffiae TaxID=2016507 RepID=UPI001E42BFCA|nr:hypothetical protein [Enemella dayhoffiae]
MEPGRDQLTLFTCTPYAVNTHRLLVRGHRVPHQALVDQRAMAGAGFTLEPWMYALIGGAAAGLALVIVIGVRERRRTRRAVPARAAV